MYDKVGGRRQRGWSQRGLSQNDYGLPLPLLLLLLVLLLAGWGWGWLGGLGCPLHSKLDGSAANSSCIRACVHTHERACVRACMYACL